MILEKIARNIKKTRLKKMPFTTKGFQIYYPVAILIVLIIGFSQIFS